MHATMRRYEGVDETRREVSLVARVCIYSCASPLADLADTKLRS
jgi:hypothetical protein